MTSSLSIVFAGTPEFSVPPLKALLASGHRVVAVYTQPDRPAGRGRQLAMSAVKRCALDYSLPVLQPATLREPDKVAELAALEPDVMVVVAYGLILPQTVLSVPRLGCLNIHASLLPRWRGAAPIQRAILAGDERTGISIMQMDRGLDTGPVLLERIVEIDPRETSATLHDKLAATGAEAIITALNGLTNQSLHPQLQPQDGVTYAAKITKEEALIDWQRSAAEIDRQVRAFIPWPIAETRWRGEQLRLWEAELVDCESDSVPPGTVLHVDTKGFIVSTREGCLRLLSVQQSGRKPVTGAEFARAHTLVGTVLGA